ncbi:MAG: biotin transporter BioY [candidate division WOR-3 bacterium]|nr:MAG: biotin transporter BioY [candidate division WOR-3 bacterium]
MTYAEVLRPTGRRWTAFYDSGLVVGGSLFIALSARLTVPLPFSPVPLTGQTMAVLLVGAVLGARRGSLTVLLYLLQGAAGLPVFAAGGAGLGWLLGPTGGYLLGFLPAAALAGLLSERGWDRRVGPTLLLMLAGNVLIYVFGLAGLARFVPAHRLLAAGLLPFLPGDAVKAVGAALLLPGAWRLLRLRC